MIPNSSIYDDRKVMKESTIIYLSKDGIVVCKSLSKFRDVSTPKFRNED